MNKTGTLDIIIFMILLILLVQSCKKDEFKTSSGVDIIIPSGDENYLNEDSDYIFAQSKLLTIELNLPEGALAYIDAEPAKEEYVEGSLTFEGETISPVNIRYKGSSGAWVNSLSGTNMFDITGYKVATKLSLKIKFNWNNNGRTFYGLQKLQLHSQNLDPSQMHERLGYWLFGQMGVPAPRSVHARVIINGTYYGLYALTEQIDESFANYHFSDGSGNIYKEVWPITKDGKAKSSCAFLRSLKTNTIGLPNADMILSFAKNIEAANDSDSLKTVIEQYMDIEKTMAYVVVDRMIGNDDGVFHWYCGNGCSNHNFFWYEEPSAGKIHLIPWDLDNAFENILQHANPVTPIANEWNESSNNCESFPYGEWDNYQKSAACDKLIGGWTLYDQEYNNLKTEFINGPFSVAEADAMIDLWANQIRSAIEEAAALHDDAISIEEWENAIENLKNQLEYSRTH